MATLTKFANANAVLGTEVAWTNPTYAYADDTSFATAAPARNTYIGNIFRFPAFSTAEIPDASILNSITITALYKVTGTLGSPRLRVQVANSTTLLGTASTHTAAALNTEYSVTAQVTSGITLADLRNATLAGGAVDCTRTTTTTGVTFNLDYVTITVDYTPPPADAYGAAIWGTTGLVSYWRLGEPSGLVANDVKNVSPGTYAGPLLAQPGISDATTGSNTSASFDGVNDDIDCTYVAALNLTTTFSLEAWINPVGTGVGRIFYRGGYYTLVFDAGGRVMLRNANDGSGVDFGDSPVIPSGQWTHVVLSKPDNTLTNIRLYVNGAAYTPTNVIGSWTTNPVSPHLWIGSDDLAAGFYHGNLDELAIYSTALSQATAINHFTTAGYHQDAAVTPRPATALALGPNGTVVVAQTVGTDATVSAIPAATLLLGPGQSAIATVAALQAVPVTSPSTTTPATVAAATSIAAQLAAALAAGPGGTTVAGAASATAPPGAILVVAPQGPLPSGSSVVQLVPGALATITAPVAVVVATTPTYGRLSWVTLEAPLPGPHDAAILARSGIPLLVGAGAAQVATTVSLQSRPSSLVAVASAQVSTSGDASTPTRGATLLSTTSSQIGVAASVALTSTPAPAGVVAIGAAPVTTVSVIGTPADLVALGSDGFVVSTVTVINATPAGAPVGLVLVAPASVIATAVSLAASPSDLVLLGSRVAAGIETLFRPGALFVLGKDGAIASTAAIAGLPADLITSPGKFQVSTGVDANVTAAPIPTLLITRSASVAAAMSLTLRPAAVALTSPSILASGAAQVSGRPQTLLAVASAQLQTTGTAALQAAPAPLLALASSGFTVVAAGLVNVQAAAMPVLLVAPPPSTSTEVALNGRLAALPALAAPILVAGGAGVLAIPASLLQVNPGAIVSTTAAIDVHGNPSPLLLIGAPHVLATDQQQQGVLATLPAIGLSSRVAGDAVVQDVPLTSVLLGGRFYAGRADITIAGQPAELVLVPGASHFGIDVVLTVPPAVAQVLGNRLRVRVDHLASSTGSPTPIVIVTLDQQPIAAFVVDATPTGALLLDPLPTGGLVLE